MSDFISGGWSMFIGAVTIVGLVACLALLIIASKRKVMSDDNTTGHVWDEDLKELNNPLPRWWMWLFVITVVFAAAYLALYPGLGSHPGTLKWSSALRSCSLRWMCWSMVGTRPRSPRTVRTRGVG